MAVPVRQPIDIHSLEKYIDLNLPVIKTPIEVLQVQPSLSLRIGLGH